MGELMLNDLLSTLPTGADQDAIGEIERHGIRILLIPVRLVLDFPEFNSLLGKQVFRIVLNCPQEYFF